MLLLLLSRLLLLLLLLPLVLLRVCMPACVSACLPARLPAYPSSGSLLAPPYSPDASAPSSLRVCELVRLYCVGRVDIGGPRARLPELEDAGEALGRHVAIIGAGGAADDPMAVSATKREASLEIPFLQLYRSNCRCKFRSRLSFFFILPIIFPSGGLSFS